MKIKNVMKLKIIGESVITKIKITLNLKNVKLTTV